MKLLINTATTHKGGGVQVALSFIQSCKAYHSHEFIVVLGVTIGGLIDQSTFPDNFRFYQLSYRPAEKVLSFEDQAKVLKEIELNENPDVVFTTSGPSYWRPKRPHLMGYNLPHYIYQDSPYFSKIGVSNRLKWKFKGKLIKYFTKRDADAYVVQTEDVNSRLQNWLKTNKPVYTVSNTYSNNYNNSEFTSDQLLLPQLKNNEFRFLILSAYYAHKNIEVLNEVIPLLEAYGGDIKFVTTLTENQFENVFNESIRSSIINIGPQRPEDCPQLYKECHAIFLPTLLECFSASYAEAMKMKRPIVTTNLGFAKSICGSAALYYNPLSAEDAANQIISLMTNNELKEGLLKAADLEITKFSSAEERARKYINICLELLNNG
ncbi:glycosyltransferase [Mangrovimonas aestuarii]|uniref:glycosyltransferase n=1 Tax=Mangrovimonas aestuarii TaxID=3018443 RepID=UPI0023796ACC|nr:glycosyltransferase [Mangrovimonas aestuarii]